MNKKLMSLLLLLTLTLPVSAQWTWQNPLPPGNGFSDIKFLDSLNGWACGGLAAKTTNGGKSWILLESPSKNALNTLFFINKNKGFVSSCSLNSQTFITNDGGKNWEKVEPLNKRYVTQIQFLDENTGYVLEQWDSVSVYPHLFKTTDGGLRWNNCDPFPNYLEKYTFFFLDENYGWMGTDGGIVRTTDAGKTWERALIPGYATPPAVAQIHFINNNQGFSVGNPSVINSVISGNFFAFTNDGGATWTKRALPDAYATLNAVHFLSDQTGYVATKEYPHGRIFYTSDAGSTWRTLEGTAEKFSFADSLRAWGLDNSNIISTQDGWMSSHSDPPSVIQTTLNSVSALDSENIVAAGDFSTIVLTNDGGRAWKKLLSSDYDSVYIQSVFYKNAHEIWALGSRSSVLWSVDGGKKWNKIQLGALTYRLSDIALPDDTTGFILSSGNKSGIIYTGKALPDRSGMIWQKTHEFPFGINKIKFTKTGTGYIAGDKKIMKSTDRGATWKELQVPADFTFLTLDAIDSYVWTVAGNEMLLSKDGGTTWSTYKAYDYPSTEYPYASVQAMSFADTLNGVIGLIGEIFRTTDGGMSWKEDNKITPAYVNSMVFTDKDHAWAVGGSGMILNYNSRVSDVRDIARLKLSSYYLEQNYPNPFNPQTTIRYNITKTGMVTLKVYDILGHEIAALINEVKSPGAYAINFDAGRYRLSSGVYIYRIQVNEFTAAKKLVFMK